MKVTIEISIENLTGYFNQIEITPFGVFFNSINSSGDTFNLGMCELENTEEIFGKPVEKLYTVIVLTPEGEEDQYCFLKQKDIDNLKSQGYKILEIEEV